MTTEKPSLSDNVFLIRFKALYEFYKQAFINPNTSGAILISNLAKTIDINLKFLFANITYLERFGYLQSVEIPDEFNITYRGTKFVERITDGDVSFSDEDIISNKDAIITWFQREIGNNND
jgi:hypothetical protein